MNLRELGSEPIGILPMSTLFCIYRVYGKEEQLMAMTAQEMRVTDDNPNRPTHFFCSRRPINYYTLDPFNLEEDYYSIHLLGIGERYY